MEEKITSFTITPEAYLFGIAKNLMLKAKIKERKTSLVGEFDSEYVKELDYNIFESLERQDQQYRVKQALGKLKEGCRKILTLYYYKRYSIESIQHELGYNNQDTVKSRKSQCMKQLRYLIKKN